MGKLLLLLLIMQERTTSSGLSFLEADFSFYELMGIQSGYTYPHLNSKREAQAGITLYPSSIKYGYLGWSYSERLSVAVRYLNSGEMEMRDDGGSLLGSFTYQLLNPILSYTHPLCEKLFLYTLLGVMYEGAEEYKNYVFHMDAGGKYFLSGKSSLIFILRNMGWNREKISLPVFAELSISYNLDIINTVFSLEYWKGYGPFFTLSMHRELTPSLGLYYSFNSKRGLYENEGLELVEASSLGLKIMKGKITLLFAYTPQEVGDIYSTNLSIGF